MRYYKCYMLYVIKAYIFELSWRYIIHFICFFPNKSFFEPSNCKIVDLKKNTSPPLLELKYEEIQRLLPDQLKIRGNLNNLTAKGKHICKMLFHWTISYVQIQQLLTIRFILSLKTTNSLHQPSYHIVTLVEKCQQWEQRLISLMFLCAIVFRLKLWMINFVMKLILVNFLIRIISKRN